VRKHYGELYFVNIHGILLITSEMVFVKKGRDFLIKIWLYTINFLPLPD